MPSKELKLTKVPPTGLPNVHRAGVVLRLESGKKEVFVGQTLADTPDARKALQDNKCDFEEVK